MLRISLTILSSRLGRQKKVKNSNTHSDIGTKNAIHILLVKMTSKNIKQADIRESNIHESNDIKRK